MEVAEIFIFFLLVIHSKDLVQAGSDVSQLPPIPQEDPKKIDSTDSQGNAPGAPPIHQAPPPDCPMNCNPDIYKPLCASNNVTYDNDCFFEQAKKCEGHTDLTVQESNETCVYLPFDWFNLKMSLGKDVIATFSVQQTPQNSERNWRRRTGSSTESHMCGSVTSVPSHLTFITRHNYYRKYTHAYGIPIVSSANVGNRALARACYVLRFLLADRKVLRDSLYRNYGRIGVIGTYEYTTQIPEHSFLGASWNQRARGLGGTLDVPISTGTEENILCDKRRDRYRDRYPTEDIFLHEFSHGIQEVAIRGGGIPGYFRRLTSAYYSARSRGLWRSTYAMSTVQEYFAEGTQSFFNVNTYSRSANGVHGPISTRGALRTYDITLYNLVNEVFPCKNTIWKRCDAAHKRGSQMPAFYMNCDGQGTRKKITGTGTGTVVTAKPVTRGPVVTRAPVTKAPPKPPTGITCTDQNQYCSAWAKRGFCKAKSGYTEYMMQKCGASCKCCVNSNASCDSWKSYCNHATYGTFMNNSCKKTCKSCQKLLGK